MQIVWFYFSGLNKSQSITEIHCFEILLISTNADKNRNKLFKLSHKIFGWYTGKKKKLQLSINKTNILCIFEEYTTEKSCFVVGAPSVIVRKDESLMISVGKLGDLYCKSERMFFRVYEGALRQQHKAQVPSLCHFNMTLPCVGVWSLFPLSLLRRR